LPALTRTIRRRIVSRQAIRTDVTNTRPQP